MLRNFALAITLSLFTAVTHAGYSSWTTPTQIEYVNDGVLVSGSFGNPSNCEDADQVFISRAKVGSEQFDPILSMILTAFSSKREVMIHTTDCFNVSYHGKHVSESTTAVFIR